MLDSKSLDESDVLWPPPADDKTDCKTFNPDDTESNPRLIPLWYAVKSWMGICTNEPKN